MSNMEELGKAYTFSSLKPTNMVTEKDLENAFKELDKLEQERYPVTSKGWFERLMNKYGWYKKQAVVVIDSSKFKIVSKYLN